MNEYIRITLCIILLLYTLTVTTQPALAVVFSSEGTILNDSILNALFTNSYPIYTGPAMFYYSIECISCLPAVYYLDDYVSSNPETDLIEYAISPSEIPSLLEDLTILHRRSAIILPVAYIGPIGIEGTEDIIRYFSEIYSWYMHQQINNNSILV